MILERISCAPTSIIYKNIIGITFSIKNGIVAFIALNVSLYHRSFAFNPLNHSNALLSLSDLRRHFLRTSTAIEERMMLLIKKISSVIIRHMLR